MVKAVLEIKVPKKIDGNVGKAFLTVAEGVSSVLKLPEKTLNLLEKGSTTLLKPIASFLNGQAEIIEAKSFTEANLLRKEKSQCLLALNVAETFAEKEQNGENLPPKIEDTDNLFAIQNAASETTDEDFIKFWARLYTEEACKPNLISKKTVDLCRLLDKKVAKILETDVFPYCSQAGFIANIPPEANNLLLLKDYGLVDDVASNVIIYPVDFEKGYPPLSRDTFGNYWLWVHPGYSYHLPYRLTSAGKEIRDALKIYPEEKDLQIIGDTISREAKTWTRLNGFTFHKDVDEKDLFVITDTLYPPFMRYPHPKYRKFEKYWEAVRDVVTESDNHKQKYTSYSHL